MIIAITNCKSMKQNYTCPAGEMYSKSYVHRAQTEFFDYNYDSQYILSAKHGLITPDYVMDPYNESVMEDGQTHFKTTHIGSWSKDTKKEWVIKVTKQINDLLELKDVTEVHFHVTGTYWNPIKKSFENHPKVVYVKQQQNPPTAQKQYIYALQKTKAGESLDKVIEFVSTLVKGESEDEKWFYHPEEESVYGKTKDVKFKYPEWVDMGGLHRVSMSRSKQHKGWVIHEFLLPYLYKTKKGDWRLKRDHPPLKLKKQTSFKDII